MFEDHRIQICIVNYFFFGLKRAKPVLIPEMMEFIVSTFSGNNGFRDSISTKSFSMFLVSNSSFAVNPPCEIRSCAGINIATFISPSKNLS